MHQETLIEVIQHSFLDTVLMVPVLFILYFLLEYLWHERGIDLISFTKISGKFGPLAGTLLGILPQCGMSVFVTSLYLSKRVTLGTLVATYLATSDEALPILIAHGEKWEYIAYLVGIKFIVGLVSGYAIDAIIPNKFYEGIQTIKVSTKVVEIKTELEKTKYGEIVKHSLQRTLRIYAWVVSITLVIGLVLFFLKSENLVQSLNINQYLQVVIVGIFGLVPNCGMSVAIVEGFLHAGVSFGATVAGLSSGSGYGPIVLFKDGEAKYGIRAILICLIISILVGFIFTFISSYIGI
ncbi:MAG: arsenic efflux protein [Bacteroidetes bacterium]|nr:arsenic efflux protein [Bacteroidota bacterium]